MTPGKLTTYWPTLNCTRNHLWNVHKEDINEFQWSQIEAILKVKRPREKDKCDVDKWKDLWQVLFPNDVAPEHPCEHRLDFVSAA